MAAAKPRRKAANTHKLPEPIPESFIVTDATRKSWIIGREIGSGGFGRVYFGAQEQNPKDFDYVIKVEYHANGPLFAEMHCYQRLGKPKLLEEWTKKKQLEYLGLSPGYGFGSFEYQNSKYRFMVIERYGKDLQKLLEENGNTFPLKTVYLVGLSVLNAVEYMHANDYLHGDIKAANLLLGRKRGTEDQVYLVDLGMASKFSCDGVHKANIFNVKKAHNGTLEFTSRDAHNGTFSRRSDLEILCYNMLRWLCGHLPWERMTLPPSVQKEKEKYLEDVDSFLKFMFPKNDCPDAIVKLLRYICNLSFESDPDYDYCRKLLKDGLKKAGNVSDHRLVFQTKKTTCTTSIPVLPEASDKENKKKAATKPATRKKKAAPEIILPPDIVPTAAMLEILNKRQNLEKVTKSQPRKRKA